MTGFETAAEIAAAVGSRQRGACEVIDAALGSIERGNKRLNAFSAVTAERARARAAAIDAAIDRGEPAGPLAGVPFAVKNLIDIVGLSTLAGSRINRDYAAALGGRNAVTRLEAAGAILVGALNMGEYAYDFTGENYHDGPSRIPHDPTRMTGGSSGGSGGAVGGGLVPIALGSDTNGSIRVPASFCGVFGLKPTYGRLSRAGSFPFVSSLDHLGPLARCTRDLALAYDAMQGPDPRDPFVRAPPGRAGARPCCDQGIEGCALSGPVAISAPARRPKPCRRSTRRGRAWRGPRDRDYRGCRAALGRLCHHRVGRRGACISTGFASGREISIRTSATG